MESEDDRIAPATETPAGSSSAVPAETGPVYVDGGADSDSPAGADAGSPGRSRSTPWGLRLNSKVDGDGALVTRPLRVAAAWSWRILVVIALVVVVIKGLTHVMMIVISCSVALLLALLLAPLIGFLRKRLNVPPAGAAALGLLSGIAIVIVLLGVAMTQLIGQVPRLVGQTVRGIQSLIDWVSEGPLGLDTDFVSKYLQDFQEDAILLVQNYGGTIATEALSFASSAVSLAAAGLIVLFVLFFMLKDGRRMWIWFVRMFPRSWRNPVNEAGIRGWVTLGWYIRTQLKVAAIDALGIGIGALALGVPAAIPIMVLVFFFAFIPIVGAFVSGAVAVLLALVNNGVTSAIIMLVVVLVVQQLEGNVLHPWLMSSAVSLHPVAVVLAVTAGGGVAGIAGAIFAVPLLAFLNVTVLYLHGHDMYPQLDTDDDRPGGPPGSLERQIEASYSTAHKVKAGQKKRGNADAGEVEVEPADATPTRPAN